MKHKKSKQKALTHKEVSRRGGIARAKNLNPEQRKRIASWGGRTAASNRKRQKSDSAKGGK